MRKLVLIPLLTLSLACGDGNPLQPGDELSVTSGQPDLHVSQAPGQNEKWAFQTDVTFLRTVDPGAMRLTPSGVAHVDGLVNEFEMNGDLNGSWFFIGKAHVNLNNGKARSIAPMVFVDITGSALGVGTFECRASGKIENYTDPEGLVQYGNVTGCHGAGDFDGMRMKAYITNEANPGGFPIAVYDFSGEIW